MESGINGASRKSEQRVGKQITEYMKYTIKGSLCGYLCDNCSEPLSGMQLLLYIPWQKERILETTVANAKETFHLVSKKEAEARKGSLIATTTSDEKGNFEFEVREEYANTAFDIDFICGSVPRGPKKPPRKEPLQFHITTVYPQWRMDKKDREGSYFLWKHCITTKWWCYIRGYYFDAWVICGHLTSCETGVPIVNATVTAWDADFITDDNLGTALTDAKGHFRIDYTSIQFKQTFLSPLFNVETDTSGSPPFNSGPDVYFKASIGGFKLIDETAADRRNNVSYCLCVNLCTRINVGDPGNIHFTSAWTGIGSEFNVPTDFDVDGYAGSAKYGLTGTINLTGQASPKTVSGNDIVYRFLVSDTATNGASPSLTFTKIVGVTPGLFEPGIVAGLQKIASPDVYNVISDQADFDSDGWFNINNAIARTLLSLPSTNINDYSLIEVDTLIAMNTGALTTAPDVASGVANAGDVFPAGSKITLEKVAIRFEIRDAVTLLPIPGTGKTLNSAVINNNLPFMKFAVQELETLGTCSPITGTIHAKYTVHHPHLQSVRIYIQKQNTDAERKYLSDSFITLPANTNASVNAGNNNSLQINASPNDLVRCTYIITLEVERRLHNGGQNGQVATKSMSQTFFYDI